MKLRPKSLGEQVATALRDAILSGRFAPGASLREATLAKDFGVARNTVREALRILAGERLVSYQLHHGVIVSTLTESDVTDLYAVRALLEPAALLDASNHRPETVQAVLDAVQRLDDATKQSDLVTVVERDLDFHRSIVALRNSPRLNEFFIDICAEVRRCVILVIYAHGEHESSDIVDDHRLITEALVAHDYQLAADLVVTHVNATRDRALNLIKARAASSGAPPRDSLAPPATPTRQRTIPRRTQRRSTANNTNASERYLS